MDQEAEIVHLMAEVMAVQSLLAGMLRSLKARLPEGDLIAQEAFQWADDIGSATLTKLVQSPNPGMRDYALHMNKVIEGLRSSVWPDQPLKP